MSFQPKNPQVSSSDAKPVSSASTSSQAANSQGSSAGSQSTAQPRPKPNKATLAMLAMSTTTFGSAFQFGGPLHHVQLRSSIPSLGGPNEIPCMLPDYGHPHASQRTELEPLAEACHSSDSLALFYVQSIESTNTPCQGVLSNPTVGQKHAKSGNALSRLAHPVAVDSNSISSSVNPQAMDPWTADENPYSRNNSSGLQPKSSTSHRPVGHQTGKPKSRSLKVPISTLKDSRD
jgi:hypothetical protein